MSRKILPLIIQGTPISPGLAQGTIHAHHGLLGPVDVPVTIDQNNVKEEFSRLDAATAPPRLGAMIETPAAALAARPEHIQRLLQCGIRTFSIAAPLIPVIKETIRNSWCSDPLNHA